MVDFAAIVLQGQAFLIRGLIFIGGWSLYRYFSRKFSIAQDLANDNKNFKRNFHSLKI